MEIWYDSTTKEIKAVYSDKYNGNIWQNSGYISKEYIGSKVPRDFFPGAIVDIDNINPAIFIPAPIPIPDSKYLRLTELSIKLSDDTITFDEFKELNRLERGL
jgi:hypothetical protein